MSRSILITGGSGFVGSSLAIRLKQESPDSKIIALDNLKRRGSELNLPRLKREGVQFIHGDVRNKEDFYELPEIDTVIDASAEPSVLAGVRATPDYVVNTNLLGTINCLDFAVKNGSDFIFLSTSRVYPIERIDQIIFKEDETRFSIAGGQSIPGVSERGISESFPIDGFRSIYGATKLCSELLIAEYSHFYGLRTVINRCGVVAGPWQMGKIEQGVAVLWIARHLWKGHLDYLGYGGKGKQVRDILHVDDLAELISLQVDRIDRVNGETFNVGGGIDNSVSLCELTAICRRITGNDISIGSVTEDRVADIRIYVTDGSKVAQSIGWKPKVGVEQICEDIYRWMVEYADDLEPILR